MRRFLLLGAVLGGLAGLGSQAEAACTLSDMAFSIGATTYNPSVCANGIDGSGNPTAQTTSLNTQLSAAGSTATPFTYLDSSDPASAAGPALNGILFTTTATNTVTGTWTITWVDTNGPANLNLPITIDLGVALIGGSNGEGYEFDNVLLPAPPDNSGSGTFTVTFLNPSGHNFPQLSHLILAGSHAAACTVNCDTTGGGGGGGIPTPEPASMLLLGAGLAGLGMVRRRRWG